MSVHVHVLPFSVSVCICELPFSDSVCMSLHVLPFLIVCAYVRPNPQAYERSEQSCDWSKQVPTGV